MSSDIEKEPQEIVAEDLRKYLTEYQASQSDVDSIILRLMSISVMLYEATEIYGIYIAE